MPKPTQEIQRLKRFSTPQAGRYEKLRLDKNEHVSGFSQDIISKLIGDISPHFLAAYPEPSRLYSKIARMHRVPESHILLTAGSEMAIRYAFECYLNRRSEVVFLDPSFAMFEVFALMRGATPVKVPFFSDLSLPVETILNKIGTKTKLIAIANPNNPTGTVLRESDLIQIAEKSASVDALLIIDEAYYYFYKKTMIRHLNRFKNLLVTRTFSKACGLASIRLGYAVGHPEVISMISRLQPIDHCNAFALKIGEALLDHEDLIWKYADAVSVGKVLVMQTLEELGFYAPPTEANFLLIDLKTAEFKARLIAACEKNGVLIGTHVRLPFDNQFIRITLGPVQEMKQFLRVFRSIVKGETTRYSESSRRCSKPLPHKNF